MPRSRRKINKLNLLDFLYDIKDNLVAHEYTRLSEEQKEQVVLGMSSNVGIRIYTKRYFTWEQMKQIRIGLEKGLDVSIYAKKRFNEEQMLELRLGLEEGLDVQPYARCSYSGDKMMELRYEMIL